VRPLSSAITKFDIGVIFLNIFSRIFSSDETDSTDVSANISIYWDRNVLGGEEADSLNDYMEAVFSREDIEPSLEEINQWLSKLDDFEENWSDVNISHLELRASRLEQPGSYSDEVYLAIDLESSYIVKERNLPSDSDFYLLDLSASGTSFGLPEAEKIASIDYDSL
jgi:hypothetical protein